MAGHQGGRQEGQVQENYEVQNSTQFAENVWRIHFTLFLFYSCKTIQFYLVTRLSWVDLAFELVTS